MYRAPKNFEKQQKLFQKMPPEQLSLYCLQHPQYSLPVGIRNQREKEALAIMEDCAQNLPRRDRQLLATYINESCIQDDPQILPGMINAFYAPLLKDKDFEKDPLKKAIREFTGLIKAPMTCARYNLLQKFVEHVSADSRKATAFEKGMDTYK